MGRIRAVVGLAVALGLAVLFAWPKQLVVVSTAKICQLTGDFDRDRLVSFPERRPFGVTGSDLGYPVEHQDQLFFLFGDTRDEPEDRRVRDAHGFDSLATGPLRPPDPDSCVPLEFSMEESSAGLTFQRIRLAGLGKAHRPMGVFETPISGFSHAGFLYAFFTVRDGTSDCPGVAGPNAWRQGCALGDAPSTDCPSCRPGGQTYLARSSDRGRTFEVITEVTEVRECEDCKAANPPVPHDAAVSKFHWVVPAKAEAADIPGLPRDQFDHTDQLLLMWGTGREEPFRPSRHSYPYLALAKLSNLTSRSTWVYYCAPRGSRVPQWCDDEKNATPLFSPESDRYGGPDYHRCLGEFSVAQVNWGGQRDKWMMMYSCGATDRAKYDPDHHPEHYNPLNLRGIHIRIADNPWGPWSLPHRVFEPWAHGGYCHFMHAQGNSCVPNAFDEGQRDGEDEKKRSWGGEYAPFLIPSFTEVEGEELGLYFVMSTWNPYQVVLMRTRLRPARPWELSRTDLRRFPWN